MTYTVEINMKKVKKKLIDSGVKTHLKPIVTVSVEASTPDEACANAIDKVLKEIKENKKTAHPNKTKEIQLRPRCEQHDFDTKIAHAIDFLCSEMKVKVYLRFRGRENAHKEFGFDAVKRFLEVLNPYGKADTPPASSGAASRF